MPRHGSTAARGYGRVHEAARRMWEPRVKAGQVNCWRCGRWINPAEPWDLGHDDYDRTTYKGPEHRRCNRSAGGIKGNRSALRRRISVRAITADRW